MISAQRMFRVLEIALVSSMIFAGTLVGEMGHLQAAPKQDMPQAVIKEKEPDTIVNVNKAGLEELQSVRGIGPSLAERIIRYREENGPFRQIDDLAQVRGIGAGTLQRIKKQIAV